MRVLESRVVPRQAFPSVPLTGAPNAAGGFVPRRKQKVSPSTAVPRARGTCRNERAGNKTALTAVVVWTARSSVVTLCLHSASPPWRGTACRLYCRPRLEAQGVPVRQMRNWMGAGEAGQLC